ncbi:nitroreductase family deazaflavin-dependent oxidoreductase [Phenylobacterium sp. LjRoot225]|uniref:nitroreductase family deazaflavin-dependent oxidoreductase n=1 Tax=Phenylobacterium sp. LjRoot225 TaxID=3342285 RepID=UPI003ED154DB
MSDPRPPSAFPPIDVSLRGEDHVRLYRETQGEQGYIWNGAPILLLTTRGRKSGEARTIPIIYTPHGAGHVIIASKGGSPTHPLWYMNVLEDPHVQVQVKADVFDAVARTAEPPERERIWAEAVKTWPRYDEYQSRTSRQIPVVVLDRA